MKTNENNITVESFQEIADMFNKNKIERKGYILLPSFEGFQLFEIDEERLRLYLKMESIDRNNPYLNKISHESKSDR